MVFLQVVDNQTISARLWQLGEGEADFTPEAACVAGIASIMLNKTIGGKVRVCMGGGISIVEWGWGRGVKLTTPSRILECAERYAS